MNYHVTINSFYVQIVRVKYSNLEYIKCHLKYFQKGSNRFLAETKNLKLSRATLKFWENYNE